MSIVSNNIKYLRRLNGLTQEQFARKIAIKRSLLGAYEEARANPNLTNLKNMAAAFGITVDNLLKNDLRKLRETPDLSLPLSAPRPMTVSHSGNLTPPVPARTPTFAEPQPLSKIIENYQQPEPAIRMVSRQVNFKPINGDLQSQQTPPVRQVTNVPSPLPQPAMNQPSAQIPVFNNQYQPNQFNNQPEERSTNYPTIQWVANNLQFDYLSNFQNPSYLTNLPSFQLPNLPSGYYRAFESSEDFTYPGALLVGTFIRNWYDIKDGMQYVFVLRGQGFVCRKAYNQVKEAGILLLTSDNPSVSALEVPLQEVLEVWEVKAFISTQMPTSQPSLERVSQLIDELQMELGQYKQR
ncbi:helix-turn-helix domain-containing protein [Dyadobacter arcticus]|uniref:Transcriptional regulator with XRE-family HTH domain n=1 Tax=Dyadobacter arcticus TaxID=1078754 RepID=A0ABX0ULU3_9BACT|nr:helix-turn-helix domain-containing protein [Dyadobacter arcticus]NIJ53971.1 transcriptional regulator with XRE-family HTH domain [Dyadobacter arcticus]